MKVDHSWQDRDWLAVGDKSSCIKYVKTKFHGFEYVNMSVQESTMSNKDLRVFFDMLKKLDKSRQGIRRNRIYYSSKGARMARAKTGKSLGATGLIIMNGTTIDACEKFFSGEPFKYVIQISYDFAQRKLTLVKLKGDFNDDLHSIR